MNDTRGFFSDLTFSLIRLSPIVAPALIVPAIPQEPLAAELLVKQLLALLLVLVTWNMTEGTAILWIKAKNDASDKTRSYLLATMICAMLSVGLLQYLRTLTSQGIFVITLVTLSLRGISRSGWENHRPLAGFVASIFGNSLIAMISFLFIAPALDWQSAVCALAIGSGIAAVEASWYAESFKGVAGAWALPLFRLSLCIGPVIITTMSMSNQISSSYLLCVVVVLLASRVLKQTRSSGEIPTTLIKGSGGIYLTFLAIMGACRFFESGASR